LKRIAYVPSHSAFYHGTQAAKPKQDLLWPNAIARLDNAG
jgi:hypothetical protein